jgi:ureidoglycolate hydrolase
METRDLSVVPFEWVSDEEFRPYGQIFGLEKGAPSEDNEFVRCWSGNVDLREELEKVDLCYCNLKRVNAADMETFAKEKGLPGWLEGFKGGTTVTKMERHPYTSESFFFLEGDVIFVVAPVDNAKDRPDLSRVRAFLCNGRLGMHLWKGTWHWPPIPAYKSARLGLVRKGKLDDFDRVDLGVEFRLVL